MKPVGSLPCSQKTSHLPVLSQTNALHFHMTYFLKIDFNIILISEECKKNTPISFYHVCPREILGLVANLLRPFVLISVDT